MAVFELGHQVGQWVVKRVKNQSILMKKTTINDMSFSWADSCCFPLKNDTSFFSSTAKQHVVFNGQKFYKKIFWKIFKIFSRIQNEHVWPFLANFQFFDIFFWKFHKFLWIWYFFTNLIILGKFHKFGVFMWIFINLELLWIFINYGIL